MKRSEIICRMIAAREEKIVVIKKEIASLTRELMELRDGGEEDEEV